MPFYDYYCKECDETRKDIYHKMQEEPVIRCGECGKPMEKDLSGCNKRDWFRPHWNENLDEKPIYIESKQQYREECKKRGLVARCLM